MSVRPVLSNRPARPGWPPLARRLLAAGAGALLAFALQPGVGARAGVDDTANGFCPLATGIPAVTKTVIEFAGSVSCFRPGGAKFGSNVAPGTQQVRPAAPRLGDECRNIYHYPVNFTEDTSGGEQAHYAFSDGQFHGSSLVGDDATMIGTNDAYVSDVQLGSYELSNPNDPASALTCHLDPTFHFFCPASNTLDPSQVCLTWVAHPISRGNAMPAWAPFFSAELGKIGGDAGDIHSAPSQTGVVNTPVCFWVDRMGIPQERDLTLTLAGPDDGSGRQIFYTFLARIQFIGIRWHFDDPKDANDTQVAPATQCGSHPELTAHQYQQISEGHSPDNRYHVTADEQYSVTVDMFWFDSGGKQGPVPVSDPTVTGPVIHPTAAAQYVGQVEGIPIGSP
jgi:hypothetical protein